MTGLSIWSPDYVYRPWSAERRAAASAAGKARAQGIIIPRVDVRAEIRATKLEIERRLAASTWTPADSEPVWSALRARKKLAAEAKRKAERERNKPRVALAYPFIMKRRDEHTDILAVNDIVPKNIAADVRADICQEVMLAVLEGRTTIDALRARRDNAAFFIKKFYRENYEAAGHAISFDDQEDHRTYDEVASSIAAKEWHSSQRGELNRYDRTLQSFSPPTQMKDLWRAEISREQERLHAVGYHLSLDEVEELMADGRVT